MYDQDLTDGNTFSKKLKMFGCGPEFPYMEQDWEVIEGLLEGYGQDASEYVRIISFFPQIWGCGAEFPYISLWAYWLKNTNRDNLGLEQDWKFIEGSSGRVWNKIVIY